MTPASQKVEIELARTRALEWFREREDMNLRVEECLGYWLAPVLSALKINANTLAVRLRDIPQAYPVRILMMEEAFGSSDDGQLFERYLTEAGANQGGLRRRYVRRLARSTPQFLSVRKIEPGKGFEVSPLDSEPRCYIHDREGSREVVAGDALIARLIDMPAGPTLGEGLIRVGNLVGCGIPNADYSVIQILSDIVLQQLSAAPEHSDRGEAEERARAQAPRPKPPPPRSASPEREKLLNRVRKLFAMAQESEASPHEAEIALRRCQSLMTKYGITEADLETSAFATVTFGARRTVPTHLRILASAVAELHDVLFVTGTQGHTEYRGYDIDAKVAQLTLDYLLDAVERALKARKRQGDFPAGRSAAYDYRLGFAEEVEDRVASLISERKQQQRKAAGGTGTELALRKLEIVERECGQDLVTRSYATGRAPQDAVAHGAGRLDGANVSLEQQVGSSAGRPSLTRN